jgi:DNA-binding protein H-NS
MDTKGKKDNGTAAVQNAELSSKSIEELWALREEVAELLAAKIVAEKEELERRLEALHPGHDQVKARRPYPRVLPKFANPDSPDQVWSGRGMQPLWVKQKLASGLALQDLSIGRTSRPDGAGKGRLDRAGQLRTSIRSSAMRVV